MTWDLVESETTGLFSHGYSSPESVQLPFIHWRHGHAHIFSAVVCFYSSCLVAINTFMSFKPFRSTNNCVEQIHLPKKGLLLPYFQLQSERILCTGDAIQLNDAFLILTLTNWDQTILTSHFNEFNQNTRVLYKL